MYEHDYMEFGSLIALEDGWFLDTNSQTRFRLDQDGNPINEKGEHLSPDDMYGDDDEVRE